MAGNHHSSRRAMAPRELEGQLYRPGHLMALRDQPFIALDTSISTKHLASFSVNFCILCSSSLSP